jgi:hypothetical protein
MSEDVQMLVKHDIHKVVPWLMGHAIPHFPMFKSSIEDQIPRNSMPASPKA